MNAARRPLAKISAYLLFLFVALFILLPLWALFLATFKNGNDMIQHSLNLSINFSELHVKIMACSFPQKLPATGFGTGTVSC